jgi:hypothetical protein
VERYEYKEVSIMGGEPELDVWVGRKGTIPIPDEHDCESISRGNLLLQVMSLYYTASKMQTAENKQKQEEQVAREAAQRAVIEYKKCIIFSVYRRIAYTKIF